MMSDVGHVARHQIVHRHYLMPLGYQAVSHMAANETGAAGNQNSHFFFLVIKTERRRDRGTEGRRDREMERRKDVRTGNELRTIHPSVSPSLHLSISPSLRPSVSLSLCPSVFI